LKAIGARLSTDCHHQRRLLCLKCNDGNSRPHDPRIEARLRFFGIIFIGLDAHAQRLQLRIVSQRLSGFSKMALENDAWSRHSPKARRSPVTVGYPTVG
jgi:hypothetical protein